MISYGVRIVSLWVIYVSDVCVAFCFLTFSLSMRVCVVMVSYVVDLAIGSVSWFMGAMMCGWIEYYLRWVWEVSYVLDLMEE